MIVFKGVLIGLGLAGIGMDSRHAASHAGALACLKGFELVAAVDPSVTALGKFSALFPDVPTYASVDELDISSNVDLVVFAEPPEVRLENISNILERYSPRVALLEKPISENISHARRIIELLKEKNVDSFVSFPRRSSPMTIFLKENFFNVDKESSFQGHIWYSKGPLNSAVHFLNLVDYWAGPLNKSSIVFSGKNCGRPHFIVSNDSSDFFFTPTPGSQFVHNGIDIISALGRLRYDFGGGMIEWYAPNSASDCLPAVELERRMALSSAENRFAQMYREIYKALRADPQDYNLTTGAEAVRQQELISRILNG